MTLSQSQAPRDAVPSLIGPLAHIKRYDKAGSLIGFVIDWSKPGASERFNAEENEWWLHHITNPRKSSNDHASWL